MPFSSLATPADRRKNWGSGSGPPRRLSSFLPYLAIALVLIGYGVFWLAAREILKARLAHQADQLRRAGYAVALEGQRIDGFPFRLRLHYDRLRLVGPSGWGVATPGLDAQAFVYAPGHWVILAPDGLEVERGGDGPLSIGGQALRASIAGTHDAPWRIAVEGEGLRFTTPASAHPFTFTRAGRFDVLLRPAPGEAGGQLLLRLTEASVARSSALAPIADGKPLTLDFALRLTKPSAFKGPAWASKVRAWSRAEGEAQIVRLRMDAGAANLSADSGALHVGEDGRLIGATRLHLALPSGLAVLPMVFGGHVSLPVRIVAVAAALVRGAGGALNAPLVFQDGRAVLDGFAIGRAPEVYRPSAANGPAGLRTRTGRSTDARSGP